MLTTLGFVCLQIVWSDLNAKSVHIANYIMPKSWLMDIK